MKKQILYVLMMALCLNAFAADVEKPNIALKSKEDTDAEKVLNDFLLEYDEGTIQSNYKSAVKKNASLKTLDTALPPRTPDLFASGLFMPYEDDQAIYHDFDKIFFKIKDGNWNLDKKVGVASKSGILFTKEFGFEKVEDKK